MGHFSWPFHVSYVTRIPLTDRKTCTVRTEEPASFIDVARVGDVDRRGCKDEDLTDTRLQSTQDETFNFTTLTLVICQSPNMVSNQSSKLPPLSENKIKV